MKKMNDHNSPFAEVTESSLNTWKGQCWDWEVMPTYGSVIAIETPQRILYGLVHSLSTTSGDIHRTVYTYQKSQDELKRDHPHIFEFLQTTFVCSALGYEQNNSIYYQFAPQPPCIHAFIRYATEAELKKIFSTESYLSLLFSQAQSIECFDDLLLALIQYLLSISKSHPTLPSTFNENKNQLQNKSKEEAIFSEPQLLRFIEFFSLLTANDYRRLKLFLHRAQALLTKTDISHSTAPQYTLNKNHTVQTQEEALNDLSTTYLLEMSNQKEL